MDNDNDIWWVRHGESIGNFYENAFEDKYPETSEKEFQEMRVKMKELECENYNSYFHGKIDMGIKTLKEKESVACKEPKSKDCVDLEKMIKTWKNIDNWKIEIEKRGKLLYKPPSSWLFTPTLSYAGILHSINAGKTIQAKLEKEIIPIFITSATVRTIMTAIYTVISYIEKNDSESQSLPTIYVMPYINENTNGAGCCGKPNLDTSNTAIPKDLLKMIIGMIATFVETPNIGGIPTLSETDVIGMINTDYYMQEQDATYDESDLTKFAGVYEDFKNKINFDNTTQRVIAFTHGNFINHKLRQPKPFNFDLKKNHIFPNNCSVWPFSIELDDNNKVKVTSTYYENDANMDDIFSPMIPGGGVRSDGIIRPSDELNHNNFATLNRDSLCKNINDLFHNVIHAKHNLKQHGMQMEGGRRRKTKRHHRRKMTRKIKRKNTRSNKKRKHITLRKRITRRNHY
jgi:hypothetical protein